MKQYETAGIPNCSYETFLSQNFILVYYDHASYMSTQFHPPSFMKFT